MQELATATEETFTFYGQVKDSPTSRWILEGLKERLLRKGHRFEEAPSPGVRFVLNVTDKDNPQSFRRRAQATFVMSIIELDSEPDDIMRTGYPYLLRTLSNLGMLIYSKDGGLEVQFVTIEQGHYTATYREGENEAFFDEIFERIYPLASSHLVINNVFNKDLELELWRGDEITEQIQRAGRELDALKLLPAPFPVDQFLSEAEFRQVRRLYGIGGLSYGNLSARKDRDRFWMSASGVNKGQLNTPGVDILLVSGYDPERAAIILSVPPDTQPNRVSVDAIEHWMVYQEHPQIGAIVHVHAWMEGISSTHINYPCGTYEMAKSVADLLREQPDPGNAVVGLRNHGVTITGPSMDAILERVRGKIVPQVPMS